jgi:hypothetical protein
MTAQTFQTGTTYAMRWVTDGNALTSCKVIKRTAKFVTFEVDGFGTKRVGVQSPDGYYSHGETAFPLGKYSMAPCVRADRAMA